MEETLAPQEFNIRVVGRNVSPDGTQMQYICGLFEVTSGAQLVEELPDGTQVPIVFASIPIQVVRKVDLYVPNSRVLN